VLDRGLEGFYRAADLSASPLTRGPKWVRGVYRPGANRGLKGERGALRGAKYAISGIGTSGKSLLSGQFGE
jgi:hypothetical protein